MQKLCNSSLNSFQIKDEGLASLTFNPTSIRWDKPTIVGAVILDLAKAFTFNFHYTQVKPNLNLELLYSDTNSFIYVVKTNDVYEDLKEMSEHYDFSNFPKTLPLYSDSNRRKVERRVRREFNRGICWPKTATLEFGLTIVVKSKRNPLLKKIINFFYKKNSSSQLGISCYHNGTKDNNFDTQHQLNFTSFPLPVYGICFGIPHKLCMDYFSYNSYHCCRQMAI